MSDSEYNRKIESVACILKADNISPDEDDPVKLDKYYKHVRSEFALDDDSAVQLVSESLMYLKLHCNTDMDILSDGKKFGMGFS